MRIYSHWGRTIMRTRMRSRCRIELLRIGLVLQQTAPSSCEKSGHCVQKGNKHRAPTELKELAALLQPSWPVTCCEGILAVNSFALVEPRATFGCQCWKAHVVALDNDKPQICCLMGLIHCLWMSIPYTQLQLQQLLNTKNMDLKNAQKSFQKTQSRLCFTKTETRHGTCRIDHCFPFFSLLSWGPEWNRSAKSVKSVKSKRCYTSLKYTKMSYKIHLSCIVYLYYIFVLCKYISLHVHTKSIAP